MLNAIFFYRISHWLWVHHIPVLPKLFTLLIFLIYNSKIPHECEIGKGTKFGYGGMGVVLHSKSKVGCYCTISQQVTIGGGGSKKIGLPVIGNNVYLAKGSIVIGGVTIGDNAIIGANAVVNCDVPANAVAAGVPAKIIKINGKPTGLS